MTSYTYKQILNKAKTCQNNVKKEYKLGINYKWSYYFAKAILTPKKNINRIKLNDAPSPSGTHISRQIDKADYLDICKRLVKYVENDKKHRLPNYITYKNYRIRPRLLTETLARLLVWYDTNNRYPSKLNINDKVFNKPSETTNDVYNYFVKTFGSFGNSIDGALNKVLDRGYSYYYDDVYTNKESINRMKKGQGINCTDACHVFYNIMLKLIALGKYKRVDCLHVQCSSGGHVKLLITKLDGSTFVRDPACCISDNGKGVSCNWCTNTGVKNPSWFMQNLKR